MKKIKFLVIFIFGLFNLCFAAEESITITTYYPSPYGSYNELATNRLAVGDTNGSGGLDAADQPNRDGDIRLKPQTGDPASWPAGTRGQFAYSSTQDSMYHHNGSVWVASGGSLSCITVVVNGPGTATCPADYIVTGGGMDDDDRSNGDDYDHPSGNGWYCSGGAGIPSGQKCYARCCKIQ